MTALDLEVEVRTEVEDPFNNNDTDPYQDVEKYSPEARLIANSKWRQLKCKTTTMSYNANWVKCIYFVIAVTCIPIGIFAYSLSQSVTMQEFPAYNKDSDCSLKDEDWGKECTIDYTLDYDFDPPIYFHYKLSNFYQNHRSYVKSRSEDQLQGDSISSVTECDPTETYKGEKLLPCGLIANSFFNDKYVVTYVNSMGNETDLCPITEEHCMNDTVNPWSSGSFYSTKKNGNWDKSHIAWPSDVEKFATTEVSKGMTNRGQLQMEQNVSLPDTDDQDFIVWMRTAVTSTFTKLHRVIHDLSFKKGDILRVTIINYFQVSDFGGTKAIVITTNNAMGGRNDALGIGFITVGSISLLTAVLFWVFVPPTRSQFCNDRIINRQNHG